MELLTDPLGDRVVKNHPLPSRKPLSLEMILKPDQKLPDWVLIKNHLAIEGKLTKQAALYIISQAKFIIEREPNIIQISDPLTIVGDIHGQFYDFLKILEIGGNPENTKYLFLGDYVDRGIFSIEVLLLLYALKVNYPKTIILLRGNHESRQMTSFFNFREETFHKYDLETYEMVMDSFDCLPLACIVNKKFIAVHGGLSPELTSINDISSLNRYAEPPRSGLFCDLLWSDPVESASGSLAEPYKYNSVRSCSYYFGQQAAKKFLQKNSLSCIIRAHEAQLEGYKMHRWNGAAKFPVVITIFSAPNYCDTYNNKGAILKLIDSTLNIQQYNCSPHPYHLPHFLDIFSWSIPFVIEKTLEMLKNILKPGGEKLKSGTLINEEIKENRKQILKNKIKTVSRMMKMFKNLRENNQTIIDIKNLSSDNKIPQGLLLQGGEALETALEKFVKIKEIDIKNEMRPE